MGVMEVGTVTSASDAELSARERELTVLVAQLEEALVSRETIGLAMGIIIARTGRDRDHAFRVLIQQSQHENRKLREVAAEIVVNAERSRTSGTG